MPASNIKVFLRIRPCAKPSPAFQAEEERGAVSFELERQASDVEVNNQKLSHNFRFDGILPMAITQEQVLNMVAKPVIDDVLSGVNGTIFAYGQTGSGKTFTITGGPTRYEDRGLIPRTIAYMFECFRRSDAQYKMYISYLEIYQDTGYDLLREDSAQKLEDLPKVQLREDDDGHFHLRNLSVNTAASQEDALNLLFLGDTNRVVAETPMNDASTRSHCLFIIWVESTPPGSDVVRRSKLHLVDLAGSERVSRTGVEGKLLNEAKAINLSLHYLERVIVALHARSQGKQMHVPYRDSMMTSVLRDSLGGNCKTTMVACSAVEASNIDETISTCRFAQRVAQIKNDAKINEELDPTLLIARLKREAAELRQELSVARGGVDGGGEEALTAEDVEQCRALVLQYVSRKVDPKEPFVCGSVGRLRCSFRILRDLCNGARRTGGTGDSAAQAGLEAEASKLRLEIAQRDQEIGVMVQMLSKQRGGGDSRPFIMSEGPAGLTQAISAAASVTAPSQTDLSTTCPASQTDLSTTCPAAGVGASPERQQPSSEQQPPTDPLAGGQQPSSQPAPKPKVAPRIPGQPRNQLPLPPVADAAALLLDQERAFEVFKQTVYRPPESFEENKSLLKEKISQAKAIGDGANQVRTGINQAKAQLERLRMERAVTAANQNEASALEDGPEELAEVQKIDHLKGAYRERTADLRRVKSEVEQIQRLLEQNRVKMQKEFEQWFVALRKQAELSKLDDGTKRELYERVVGASAPTTPAAGAIPAALSAAATAGGAAVALAAAPGQRSAPRPVREGGAGAAPPAIAAAFAANPRSVPAAPPDRAETAGPRRTGDARTDDDIAKYYAALGEVAPRG